MSTAPTEAHRKLACEILMEHSVSGAATKDGVIAAAQLIRDSEARAVEAAERRMQQHVDNLTVANDAWAQDAVGLRAELTALRERVRVLEEALKEIAQQKTRSEMEEDIGEYEAEHADWEGAYELAIKTARAALATPAANDEKEGA